MSLRIKEAVITLNLVGICWTSAYALSASEAEQQADQQISHWYQEWDQKKAKNLQTMPSKLENISRNFLGQPYILGALGEGSLARYDQFPQYRVDGFDCDTLVTTTLAIALGHNLNEFKQRLLQVRYANNQSDYTQRNHFMELDWNGNNAHKGFIQDITPSIKDEQGKPVFKIAKALIDKPSWFQHLDEKNIRLQGRASKAMMASRLEELRSKGQQLDKRYSTLAYIPFSALFSVDGQAKLQLFAQIPNGAIIEIVRPDWNLKDRIGTNLNVSHLGFAFWKNNTLYFRQASSIYHQVVDVPLIDYLQEAAKSPTIKGINIQFVKQP
jgi:hypothetical protein